MSGTASSRGDDPPLAIGEDITHTNLFMSDDHMAPRAYTAPRPPPLKLPIVKAERPFVASLDSDPVDGLVRQEVLSCDVAGLGIHELLVQLFQAAAPPHAVVVSTDAPEDAIPERWEAQVGFPKKNIDYEIISRRLEQSTHVRETLFFSEQMKHDHESKEI